MTPLPVACVNGWLRSTGPSAGSRREPSASRSGAAFPSQTIVSRRTPRPSSSWKKQQRADPRGISVTLWRQSMIPSSISESIWGWVSPQSRRASVACTPAPGGGDGAGGGVRLNRGAGAGSTTSPISMNVARA